MSQQRRLLYLHRTRARGAEGAHIRGVVRAFERCGWKVKIVSPPGVAEEETARAARGRRYSTFWSGVSEHAPQVLFEMLELAFNFYSLLRLRRELNQTPTELIYERHSLFNLAGTWMARRREIPIVLEVNDSTVIARSRSLVARWLAEMIEGWVFRNVTYLVTVSNQFKQLIVERHHIPPGKIGVLPNAVDLADFTVDAVKHCRNAQSFTLGMVAAFVAWHGLDFLVTTVAEFLKRTGSRLVLVGDGPALAAVNELIHRCQLDNHVELTGFVPARAVPSLLAQMDVCIMANSNEYGSPMKIFEYMACGKPVLAPAYGPIQEVITHRINGWLFEPLNADSLLEGIEELYGNPDLCRQLGTTARQEIVSKHTWDHRVRAIETWLDQSRSLFDIADVRQ